MGRGAKGGRDRRPRLHPVERIELSQEHLGRRLIAAAVLLVFGAAMLAYAFMQLMSLGNGWMRIEVSSSAGVSCAGDFTFFYFSGGAAERKAVTAAYTELCRTAYEQFHELEPFEGVNNIHAINRSPNEPLTVDRALYDAFSTVAESGSRLIYLGPVYARYGDLFFCQDDVFLADFDPALSEDVAREYREIAAFASSPEMIRVELLGDNRIELVVAEEYLAYAEREGIENFIDFAWMRNAFITDYLAEELTARGFTRGALTSYDGFARCLDGSGEEFSLQLYNRWGQSVYGAAVMRYQGPMSIVSLRDYPLSEQDAQHYYRMANGEVRTFYLDAADALCKSAVDTLVCYSREKGCAQVLLEMIPVYIADSFRPEALEALSAGGIASIYCEDGVLYPSEADVALTQLYEKDGVRYSVAPPKNE